MNAQDIENLEQSILLGGADLSKLRKSAPLKTAEDIRRDWLLERIGKFTASEFHRLTTAPTKDVLPVGAITYATEKVVEVLTEFIDDGGYVSDAMQWGIDNEVKAIAEFEKRTGFAVTRTGTRQEFIAMGDSIGGTPDGLIGNQSGVEVKCPKSVTHFKYLAINNGDDLKRIAQEYYWQVQGLMMLAGCSHWYFISYDPRYKKDSDKLHSVLINANEEDQEFLIKRLKQAMELKGELLASRGADSRATLSQASTLKLLKIGRTKLWKLRKENKFPEPINQNPLEWRLSDIEEFAITSTKH